MDSNSMTLTNSKAVVREQEEMAADERTMGVEVSMHLYQACWGGDLEREVWRGEGIVRRKKSFDAAVDYAEKPLKSKLLGRVMSRARRSCDASAGVVK